MKAPKLVAGDEIRIISPSRSMSMIAIEQRKLAENRLEELGFKVSYSINCLVADEVMKISKIG